MRDATRLVVVASSISLLGCTNDYAQFTIEETSGGPVGGSSSTGSGANGASGGAATGGNDTGAAGPGGAGGGGDGSGGAGAGCGNWALEFDGMDDLVEVPYAATLDPPAYTIEAWIFPHESCFVDECQIVSHHDWSSGLGWVIMMISGGGLQVRSYDGANQQAGGGANTAPPMGQWSHVAAVYDGSELRTYINGSRESQTSNIQPYLPFAGVLRIGMAAYTDNFHFRGLIDEVRLSDVARYEGNTVSVPAGPFSPDGNTVALWHFDEGAGSVAADATSAHDGRLGDTSGADAGDPVWTCDSPWGP